MLPAWLAAFLRRAPGARLFTIGQLWIWIDVYERSLADVPLGDTGRIRTQAYPDRIAEGTVSYILCCARRYTRCVAAIRGRCYRLPAS